MFALARRFLPWREAVFAAALYAVNPYHLVIVYWRSAFAELLAAAYLPLLLLLILRSEEDGRRIVAPLSLLMAAGWLTNLPSAVMMNYSLLLISVCLAVSGRRTPGRNAALPVAFAALSALLGAAKRSLDARLPATRHHSLASQASPEADPAFPAWQRSTH